MAAIEDMEDYKAFEATIIADYDARWLIGSPNGRAHSAAEEHADSVGRPLGRVRISTDVR
jgi:hypothetical protein